MSCDLVVGMDDGLLQRKNRRDFAAGMHGSQRRHKKPAEWLLERNGISLTPEDIWRAAQVNLGAFGIV